MTDCLLHIGMPKTGTTALQYSLSDYDDGHTRYARFTPDQKNPNHSHEMIAACASQQAIEAALAQADAPQERYGSMPMQWSLRVLERDWQQPPKARFFRDILARQIAEYRPKRLVISAEMLFATPSVAAEGQRVLADLFGSVRLVCYLRPFSGYIPSIIQQFLRLNYHQTLRDLVARDLFRDSYPTYRRQLAPWLEAFGRDKIDVIPFTAEHVKGRDITRDFCDRYGLDYLRSHRVRMNESLSFEATAILAAFARYARIAPDNPFAWQNKAALNILLSDFGDRKLGLDDRVMGDLRQAWQSDIDWASALCGDDMGARAQGDRVAVGAMADLWAHARDLVGMFQEFLETSWSLSLPRRARDLEDLMALISTLFAGSLRGITPRLPRQFDGGRYLALNPDVRAAGVDPAAHFIRHGYFENRIF